MLNIERYYVAGPEVKESTSNWDAPNLVPNSRCVFLAADREEPEQACPMLEYGFTFTDIEVGPKPYYEGQQAVRFFEHRDAQCGTRLTMTLRSDKNWYLWANVGGDHASDGVHNMR